MPFIIHRDEDLTAVRELCHTSAVLQETFAAVNRCEEEIHCLQETIARLNACNVELRAQLETKDHDLFVAQGERDVLRLLMTSSLSGCLPEVPVQGKKDHAAAPVSMGKEEEEYVP